MYQKPGVQMVPGSTVPGAPGAGGATAAIAAANAQGNPQQPPMDINNPGDIDGKPVIDYDLKNAKDKPWKVPG